MNIKLDNEETCFVCDGLIDKNGVRTFALHIFVTSRPLTEMICSMNTIWNFLLKFLQCFSALIIYT